ncbi:MAG: patatin-like phospholipase family protein, partial [Gammaproteobacteria bacterium]|nr:patatin-like phospholipase family protein [Gammaproteobacteria bacterium]
NLTWKEIVAYLDMSIIGGGLIQGDKLVNFFRRHSDEMDIQSLPHKFAAVATELNSGREVWLQEGDLLDAVRASSALPGLFTPVKKNNRWLIDGGIVDPVPVSLCRAMGADIVIAVSLNEDIVGKYGRNNNKNHQESYPEATKKEDDNIAALWNRISAQLEKTVYKNKNLLLSRLLGETQDSPGLVEVLMGSIHIMQDRITRSRMAGDPPDIILSPKLSHLGLLEFDQGKVAIQEGRAVVARNRAALEHITSITR